jgi:hypothetical protein
MSSDFRFFVTAGLVQAIHQNAKYGDHVIDNIA